MNTSQGKIDELNAIVKEGVARDQENRLEPKYVEFTVIRKLKEVTRDICRSIETPTTFDRTEDPTRSLVTHYTSINALFSMLQSAAEGKSGSLRLYDSVHFNDPDEGKILVGYFEKRHPWMRLEYRHPSLAYVASFVAPPSDQQRDSSNDDLVFWLTYGKECEGCSLRISIPNAQLRKVSYCADEATRTGQALLPILDAIEPLADVNEDIRITLAKGFLDSMEGTQYLYKSEAYQFENESRFLVGGSNVCKDNICFDLRNNSSPIIRHYWEHEDLSVGEIFGSGTSITIGSRVPDFDDLERSLKILIERINTRLEENDKSPINPDIFFSNIQYRKT